MTVGTFYALTPTFRPVGGVLKILDYALHARALGWRVVIACPEPYQEGLPVFSVPDLDGLRPSADVVYQQELHVSPAASDIVFFSWPTHYDQIIERLPRGFPDGRIVHIVQNVRHANPRWIGGRALRLLGRPMTRITVTDQVRDAIAPYVSTRWPTTSILLGHRTDYFAQRREGPLGEPLRVGFTTWKSTIGKAVEARLAASGRFTFRAVQGVTGWPELRELYRWSDVFLAAPGPEEGFYLPGLEAMAAGAVLITPDVGGNMAYCRFGENCLDAALDDVDDYVGRLQELAAAPAARIDELRGAGWRQVERHALTRERQAFGEVLDGLPRTAATRPSPAVPAYGRHDHDVVLTGIPRSGTTLLTHLLNRVPGVVALSEPLKPASLMPLDGPTEVVHAIEDFFGAQRERLLREGTAVSKNVGGKDRDNYFEESGGSDGLRRDVAERSDVAFGDDLPEDFTLAIKDVPTFTALLAPLSARLRTFAVVRNPLAVLASWDSVDVPFREGRSPHAEWFDPDLSRHLNGDRVERQLELLGWWFHRLVTALPATSVIRYEDLLERPRETLERIVPGRPIAVDPDRLDRATHRRYDIERMGELADALIARRGPSLAMYSEEDVRDYLARAQEHDTRAGR